MSFDRNLLPEPIGYYESHGLVFQQRRGKWRNVVCLNCASNGMRINTETGAFVCMAGCGARGGDVLAYHMDLHGLEFVEAAKQIGAWIDDGRPVQQHKPTPLPPRAALEVMAFESMLVAVAAGNVAHGVKLADTDRFRLMAAVGRINRLAEAYQ